MPGRHASFSRPRDRLIAIATAMLLQLGLVYVLIAGFAVTIARHLHEQLTVIGIAVSPPPPPPPSVTVEPRPQRATGKAAPAAKSAHAAPIVAPVITRQPQPELAANKPGAGTSATQGASVQGIGSGAGGVGSGTASGGSGAGDGDGGTDAELISGEIREHDYPPDAFAARRSGRVGLRFTVGVNGRVTDCRVTRSSGTPELDAVTCALIIKRFRYRPALDAMGRPVPQQVVGDHDWVIPALPPSEKGEEDEG